IETAFSLPRVRAVLRRESSVRWRLDLPGIRGAIASADEIYVSLRTQCDSAEMHISGIFAADHLYTGLPWEIGLKRFELFLQSEESLVFTLVPLAESRPVYLEYPPVFEKGAACGLQLEGVYPVMSTFLRPEREE
ncbi:hypothetical protein JW777_11030, partial [bacterium]|nr:hypothetical protein [bacterium]